MCGIAGFIDYSGQLNYQDLSSMTNKLAHRGPDASNCELISSTNANIGLGHRRLSIIDLSERGKQPMSRQNLHIVYNGEIYNYKIIKEKLISLGYSFKSDSDTEVIIHAFAEWGINCVSEFIGMFAFVIYDSTELKLYIFRDRAGVKPLYYYFNDDIFLFASELKAFHAIPKFEKQLEIKSLAEYFQYGYISTPNCIFSNCSKLEQGHYLVFDIKKREPVKHSYWNVFDQIKAKEFNQKEYVNETEKLLYSACNYRMVSDVPVGIFLSGGYDSSLVTALIQKDRTQKVKTFTIGFKEKIYDESKAAARVAKHLGTNHHEMICSIHEAKDIIPMLPDICDEPFGDSSIIPTYLVSKMAKEHVDVVLSSDGGDEQFIGYKRYKNSIKLGSFLLKSPKLINKFVGSIGMQLKLSKPIHSKIFQTIYENNVSNIPAIQMQNLFSTDVERILLPKYNPVSLNFPQSSNLNSIFAAEYQHYMQDDILVKVDRATMSVGLEGREPLLDHRILEWVLTLPVSVKYKKNNLKFILKEIAHKYIPEEILNRPKQGFGIPIIHWLRKDLSFLINTYLNKVNIIQQGLFNPEIVQFHLKRFQNGNPESSNFIWHMLIYQMWHERWMK